MSERIVLIALIAVLIFIIGFYVKITGEIDRIVLDLKITHSEVLKTKELLSNVTSLYEDKLSLYEDKLNEESDKREMLEKNAEEMEANIRDLKAKVEELDYIKSKFLITPSFSDLQSFIARDNTNTLQYVNNTFTCLDFSNTFVNNFAKEGYYSCVATLVFNGGKLSHAIVSVNTTDRGLIYVEPQSDGIITNLKVDDNYCSLVDWDCYWKVEKISDCFEVKT